MSADAVARLTGKYAAMAATACPTHALRVIDRQVNDYLSRPRLGKAA